MSEIESIIAAAERMAAKIGAVFVVDPVKLQEFPRE